MGKHLLSNWINVIGTILGLYLVTLLLGLHQLFISERGFTIETVFVETIGGSFIYLFGALVYHLKAFLVYVLLLLLTDVILLIFLKERLKQILITEIIIFSLLFIVYMVMEQSFIFLILPLAFLTTQKLRKKKLLSL